MHCERESHPDLGSGGHPPREVGGPGTNYTIDDGSGPLVIRVVDALSAPQFSIVFRSDAALLAASIAVGQYDIKKVLAYSTISQLGFMVAAVGAGAFVAGMFHLVTHAFFKALLFMSAGSVILGIERGHHAAAHGHGHDDRQQHLLAQPHGLQAAQLHRAACAVVAS